MIFTSPRALIPKSVRSAVLSVVVVALLHGTFSDAGLVTSRGRQFQSESILGFGIRFDTSLDEPSRAWHRSHLAVSLAELAAAAPSLAPIFRRYPIWICNHTEENSKGPGFSGAVWNENESRFGMNVFHPSIVHATPLWYRGMIAHEFGHAFHERCLRAPMDNLILEAYRDAVQSGRYRGVQNEFGGIVDRAYALLDEQEYFGELFAAYLVVNDTYPFTRADVLEHDPVGYELMTRILTMDLSTQHRPDLRFWSGGRYIGGNIYEKFPRRQRGRSDWGTKAYISVQNDGATDEIRLRATSVAASRRKEIAFRLSGAVGRRNLTAGMFTGRAEAKVYEGYDRQLLVQKRRSSLDLRGFGVKASSSLFPDRADAYSVTFQ